MQSDSPITFDDRDIWFGHASRLELRLNIHYLLSSLIPRLSVALVALGVATLALRELGVEGIPLVIISLATFFCVFCGSIYAARNQFLLPNKRGLERALVRLETILNLNSSLSAAYLGGLPWPKCEHIDESRLKSGGYQVNVKELLLKPTLALIFFLLAGIIPVHPAHAYSAPLATQLPPDLVQVQTWLDKLKQENLIDADKLKEAEDQLDQFKNHSPKEWYTQENLEGANALKESTAQAMEKLQDGLDKADQALQDGLDKTADPAGAQSLSKQDTQALQNELKKAGETLSSGNLPLKQEITKELTGAEGAKDTEMTHDQMEKMQKKLKQALDAAKGGANGGKGEGNDPSSKLSDEMKNAMKGGELPRTTMQGDAMGKGPGKGGPGKGGLGGGGTTAPLELEQRDLFADGTRVTVKTNDPSNSTPGELVNVSSEAPKVDPNEQTSQVGGAGVTQGNGGEAVWRSDYDPQEADVLRNYFKSNDQ